MKALCYHGKHDIRYESKPDPVLQDDRDIIIKTLACGICGSDLHIYHGHGFSEASGYCVGHEAVGEVVETGRAVRELKTGDRVMLSASVGCGSCPSCLSGNMIRCETGKAPGFYGLGQELDGCQAEAVRVPAAETNVARIPDGISNEQALMLTDNLPTAWMGCVNAAISPGKTVAVVGLGPVGLMAVECAFLLGASRVFAIDLVAERRAIAQTLGAICLEPDAAVEVIREATAGRMIDCVVEAVGIDATVKLSLKLGGAESTVSVVGASPSHRFDFPLGSALARGLTFRLGLVSVQRYWPRLLPLVQQGRLRPERFVSHVKPLAEGAEAYRQFAERKAGALKTMLVP